MARLVFNAGDVFTIGGSNTVTEVFGTSGKDTITIAAGAKATLFGFDSADAVSLGGNAGTYTAVRSGSSIVLTDAAGSSVTIPVSTTSQTITFADGARALVYNTASGNVELGSQAVTTTATTVTAGSGGGSSTAGQTFTLTTGIDSGAKFTGGAGNDTFEATNSTLTALDNLDGGAGSDTLNVSDIGASAATFANVTVANIETLNLTSIAGLNNGAIDTTSGFTGLTAANIVLAAPAANQSVTVAAATAADVRVSTQAANNITVLGGSTVAVTAGLQTTGTVSVGSAVAAPTGAVTVNATGNYTDGSNVALGAIAVVGGSSVSVTQSAGLTAAEVAAAVEDASNFTVTQSAVTVTGTASTTSVSVAQTAAQDEVDATASDGVIGIVNGAVTVNDVNRASATKAGTIATVSLENFGAATVNSGALTTLNLKGTGTSVDASTLGALTTAANSTLALNVAGLTTSGSVSVDSDISTINLASATAASKIATLSAGGLTTLNISGDAGLTVTTLTASKLTAINSTSSGAVTISSTLGTAVAYTGGAGVDTISLGATAAAISTGAGNDVVTMSGDVSTGGSVNAGDGDDTLKLTAALAQSLSATSAFEANISNFERVEIGLAAANTAVNSNNLDDINYFLTNGDGGFTIAINNVESGVTLVAKAAGSSTTTLALENVGTADVANITLTNAAATTFGTIDLSGFETVNLTATESGTLTTGVIDTQTVAITDADATSITAAGNAGLALTFTGTKLTSLDASAMSRGGISLTTGALASAATLTGGAGADSINASSATKAVTLSGNAGNDTLVGSAKADVINGGAGTDVITGGLGADTIDGGDGNDTYASNTAQVSAAVEGTGTGTSVGVIVNLSDSTLTNGAILAATGNYASAGLSGVASNSAAYLFGNESSLNSTVADSLSNIESVSLAGNGANYVVGSTGNNTITGGSGADTISAGAGNDAVKGAGGVDSLTGGTGADTFIIGVTANADRDVITDFSVSQLDVLSFDISDMGLNAADYAAGSVTFVTAAQFAALGAGAANNHIIVDTQANILADLNNNAPNTGGVIAIATDTGNVYFDANADFTAGAEVIATITAAQAALITVSNVTIIA